MNIYIWGYAYDGARLYDEIVRMHKYDYKVLGFVDNAIVKQGMKVGNTLIISLEDLLREEEKFSVIIAVKPPHWCKIGKLLEEKGISIEGIYVDGKLHPYNVKHFKDIDLSKEIKLYAGDICDDIRKKDHNTYGLSINRADEKHILHDITQKTLFPDNSIAFYQAEDVLEHIEMDKLVDTINEIYRILKPGALFRISLPDYFSPYKKSVSMRNENGEIVYDPLGGGSYDGTVKNGGHVWFPNYRIMEEILKKTKFEKYDFLCYHTEKEELIKKEIDFTKGDIKRVVKDNQFNEYEYSMVIDCYKC